LRQYRSAGAAFEIGIQMSTAKKDEKRVKELKQNRDAALVGLYNKGIAAMGAPARWLPCRNGRPTRERRRPSWRRKMGTRGKTSAARAGTEGGRQGRESVLTRKGSSMIRILIDAPTANEFSIGVPVEASPTEVG